jgi:hypothetical protein
MNMKTGSTLPLDAPAHLVPLFAASFLPASEQTGVDYQPT